MRLIWISNDNKVRHAIQLKHIKSIKDKSSAFKSPKIILYLDKREVPEIDKNNPLNAPKMRKIDVPHPGYMMLSFHSKTRDNFSNNLNKSLKQKAWINIEKVEEKREFNARNFGIKGIISESKQKKKEREKTVNEAFEDLESLMKHAKKMVNIANRIASSKEMNKNLTEFDKMLHDLGIQSPVTKEIAGSDYHKLLARQLCDFLTKILDKYGGMMTLTDIYCLYNKARGTELVSPDDMLQSIKLMPSLNLAMKLKQFKSGVLVCQLAKYDEKEFAVNIQKIVHKNGAIDELKLANITGISLELAREQLKSAEELGYLCRDESSEGVMYYANLFTKFEKGVMRISVKNRLKEKNKLKKQQQLKEQKKINTAQNKQKQALLAKKKQENQKKVSQKVEQQESESESEEEEEVVKKKEKKRVMMVL